MPTLGEKVAELKAAGHDIQDIRKGMEDAFGLPAKELGAKYWNSPLEQLRAAHKQSMAAVPSFMSGEKPASVLPKEKLLPTLEQQLGPGGIPVASPAATNRLTGESTPVGLPAPIDNILTNGEQTVKPEHRYVMPQLEGGIFHPVDELTKHVWPAVKGAVQEIQEGILPGAEKLKVVKKPLPLPVPYYNPYANVSEPVKAKEARATGTEEAYAASKEDLDERGRHNPVWNALTDAADFALAPLQLAGEIILPKEVHDGNTLEAQGHAFGQNLAGGLIGGTAAQLNNSAAMLYGRPLSTAAMLAPVAGAAMKGAPAAASVLGKIPKIGPALEAGLNMPVGKAAIEGLNRVIPEMGGKRELIPGTGVSAEADVGAADWAAEQFKREHARILRNTAEDAQGLTRAAHQAEAAARETAFQMAQQPGNAASAEANLQKRLARIVDQHNEDFKAIEARARGQLEKLNARHAETVADIRANAKPAVPAQYTRVGLGDKIAEFAVKHSLKLPTKFNKWIVDALDQGDPVATSIVERMFNDPEAAASEIRSIGNRLGYLVEGAEAPAQTTLEGLESAKSLVDQRLKAQQDAAIAAGPGAEPKFPRGHRHAGKTISEAVDAERKAIYDANEIPPAQRGMFTIGDPKVKAVDTAIDASVKRLISEMQEQKLRKEAEPLQAAHDADVVAPFRAKLAETPLEGAPTRDVHALLSGGEGTMEVAKPHLTEDLVRKTAREQELNNFAAKNPKVIELSDRIAARMGLDASQTAKVSKLVLDALDTESLHSLHDPAVLKEVVATIAEKWRKGPEGRSPLTPDLIKKFLKPYMDVSVDGIVAMPDIVGGAVMLNIPDIIRKVSLDLKPEARANVVRSVIADLAEQTRREGLAKNLHGESQRLIDPEITAATSKDFAEGAVQARQNMADVVSKRLGIPVGEVTADISPESMSYAANVVMEVAAGEHPPLVLPKGVTVNDAQKAFRLVDQFIRDADIPNKGATVRAAKELVTHFNNFVDVTQHVPEHTAGSVHPELAQTIKYENLARQGLQDPGFRAFNRFIKGNLTTRSPHSAINNFVSNTAMQASRRGNPLIFTDVLNAGRKYSQFVRGVEETGGALNPLKLTAEEGRIYRAIESTGVIDTDAVAQEVGLMKAGSKFNPARVAEKTYRTLGDNSFKLEETVHNFKILDNYLGDLVEGQHITADLTPRTKITFTKKGNGFEVTLPGEKPRMASGEQLDSIMAKVASKPAQDMFFDYGDTGLFAKWLKQAPILGIASPFYTWSYKALDIPFLKRGLASRVIELPFGVQTNSPKVALQQLGQAAKLGATRGAYITAARNDLLQNENGQLGDVVRRQPRQLRMYWAAQLGDPHYMGGYDYGKFNWLQPSQKLFGLMTGVAYDALAKPDVTHMSKDQAKRVLRTNELLRMSDTGQLYSAKDALDLVGMAGSPLLDAVTYLQDSDDQGKTLSIEKGMQKFAGALMSGVGRDIYNVAGGVLKDKTGIHLPGTPRHNEVDPTLQEPLVRHVIRQFTGMGYNVKNITSETDPRKPYSYYKNMQKEWLSSLDTASMQKVAKQDLADAKRRGDLSAEANARTKYRTAVMLENTVKSEIKQMYGHFAKSARALGLKTPEWENEGNEIPEATTEESKAED